MIQRARQFARRHELWSDATRIVAAVSGGSDSVALLQILHDLHASGELRLEAVAHLNHVIRGRESDEDEAFCRNLAAQLGVAFVAERVDVPALGQQNGDIARGRGTHRSPRRFSSACAARGARI